MNIFKYIIKRIKTYFKRKKYIECIKYWRKNPDLFCEEYLGIKLFTWQKKYIRGIVVDEEIKMKFKNGSTIEYLKNEGTNRGVISNFMTMPCFDLETGETVTVCLDMRKQFKRYIPIYIVDKINEERKSK